MKKQKLDHPKNLFQIESNIHLKKKLRIREILMKDEKKIRKLVNGV